MNWDAISAIAESFGAIVVVVSLGYVALQIRQHNDTVRAATELEIGRQWSEWHTRVAHSPDMADIYDKGMLDAENLTPSEKRRFIWIIAEYCFLVETLYRQREQTYVSHGSWSQHQRVVAGMIKHPLLERWWESGVSAFSPEFKAAIDSARPELGDAVWTYQPLSDL